MSFAPRTSYGNFGNTQWMAYAVARTGVPMPNCFTYATARISEIVGHNQSLDGPYKVPGAGDLWRTHAPEFVQSSTPIPGALAIYKGGYNNYGHVAVVEVVGANMAMSQSNYGGNMFDFVEVPKTPGSYYPGTGLRLCGFLIHNSLRGNTVVSTGYNEKQLINENGTAVLTQAVNKRRDTPTGIIAETLPVGKKLTYTQKWVGNGHRYISWVETEPNGNKYRYFVAISGSETHGKDMWATIGGAEDNTNTATVKKEEIKAIDSSNVKHWGVDISSNNGNVDLSKYDFAIIRACYGEYTDKKLGQWVSECNKLGIPFGLYCYDYALNDDQALAEAKYILKLAEQYQPTLGIWFDMEDADNYKKKNGVLTAERCLKSCQIFCKAVKDAGWYTGVYSSTWWFDNWLTTGLDDYDKWVAQWNANDGDYHSDTSKRGTIHQYTSIDKATGIALDKNAMYVNFGHYTVKIADNPQNEEENVQKDESNESDIKELNGLIGTLIGLLKKLLSIFGKSGD